MTKYIGVGVTLNGATQVGHVSGLKCCPADVIDWAKKELNSEKTAHVVVFEEYGTVERSAAPVIFTPVLGAKPPGQLPEPPFVDDDHPLNAGHWVIDLGTAKTGG